MKKVFYICLLFLASSCSFSKILGGNTPYAEDIAPASVEKAESINVYKEEKEVANYINDIEEIKSSAKDIEYKGVEKKFITERPVVKSVKTGKFPNIKDIPPYPKAFPSEEKIRLEKSNMLEKTIPNKYSEDSSEEILFTGLDDELLIFTAEEIISQELPKKYKNSRPILSASIDNNLNVNDGSAIELIIKDRMRNFKPMLLSFHGNTNDSFKVNTIGTLLLMGMDPSLIYVEDKNSDFDSRAEILLYY